MTIADTSPENVSNILSLATGTLALVIAALLGGVVIWRIYTDKIDLKDLIGDKDGCASMSRFQLLLFSFVVAFAFLFIVTKPDASGFPDIPGSVLTLLGISGSSYLVGKSIDGK